MLKATQSWSLGFKFLGYPKRKGNSGGLISLTNCSIIHNQEEQHNGETKELGKDKHISKAKLAPYCSCLKANRKEETLMLPFPLYRDAGVKRVPPLPHFISVVSILWATMGYCDTNFSL